MENKELITESEWYRRLIEDKEYQVISFDFKKGITTVFHNKTNKMYNVTSKKVGKKIILEVIEV